MISRAPCPAGPLCTCGTPFTKFPVSRLNDDTLCAAACRRVGQQLPYILVIGARRADCDCDCEDAARGAKHKAMVERKMQLVGQKHNAKAWSGDRGILVDGGSPADVPHRTPGTGCAAVHARRRWPLRTACTGCAAVHAPLPALVALPSMLADAAPSALLALAAPSPMLTDATTSALLAPAGLAPVLAFRGRHRRNIDSTYPLNGRAQRHAAVVVVPHMMICSTKCSSECDELLLPQVL